MFKCIKMLKMLNVLKIGHILNWNNFGTMVADQQEEYGSNLLGKKMPASAMLARSCSDMCFTQ